MTHSKRTYMLRQSGNGWNCRVRNSRVTGWGSRPELAIRDWKKQSRLFGQFEATEATCHTVAVSY